MEARFSRSGCVGAVERSSWASSYSAGGTSPSSPCSRRWLNQSMYSATAIDIVDAPPRALVADQLGLEQRVEGLGQRIVVGVAAGADRGDRAFLGQPLGIPNRGRLNAMKTGASPGSSQSPEWPPDL